jgi:hypothetical protein
MIRLIIPTQCSGIVVGDVAVCIEVFSLVTHPNLAL